jgi:hypothetical protein
VTGQPVERATAGVNSSAPLPKKNRTSQEGKRGRDEKTSSITPPVSKFLRGENDVTVDTTDGGHLGYQPAASLKPSIKYRPTVKCTSSAPVPLLRRKQPQGAPLPGHTVTCPGPYAQRPLTPLLPSPKWTSRSTRGATQQNPGERFRGEKRAKPWRGFEQSPEANSWSRRKVRS